MWCVLDAWPMLLPQVHTTAPRAVQQCVLYPVQGPCSSAGQFPHSASVLPFLFVLPPSFFHSLCPLFLLPFSPTVWRQQLGKDWENKERVLLILAVEASLAGAWQGIGRWLSGCWVPATVSQPVRPPGTVRAEPRKNSERRVDSSQHPGCSVGKSRHTSQGCVSGNHMNSRHFSCLLAEDEGRCSPWTSPQEAGRRPPASRASSTPPEPRPPEATPGALLPQMHSCLSSLPSDSSSRLFLRQPLN